MKTKNILAVIAVTFLALAMPSVMRAAACNTYTTYDQLIANSFCTTDIFRFYNFTFAPSASGGASTPTAGGVSFSVLNGTISPSGQPVYGFNFNPGISVIGPQMQDVQITFDVKADRGTDIAAIDSVHLQLIGSASNGGVAQVQEQDTGYDACSGTNCLTPSGPGLILGPPTPLVVSPGSPTTVHQDYLDGTAAWRQAGPYLIMHVWKDIQVTGTSAAGSNASISGVWDAFDKTAVPEPASVGYMILGCLALFGAARRRRKQAE